MPVVVEVGEDVSRLARDAIRPRAELPLAVAAVASTSGVEPQVAPVCSVHPRRRFTGRPVRNHERGAVRAQELVDVLGEPARVPELEGVAAGRQRLERTGEDVVVPLEARRQLPEQRPELAGSAQWLDACVHPLHSLSHASQALHVRQVTARLHREKEVVRCSLCPALDRLHGRQSVEGRIDLHSVEHVRVELEPPGRRAPLRIEDASPVLVAPAGAADADHDSGIARASSR